MAGTDSTALDRPRRPRRTLVVVSLAIVVSFAGLLAAAIGFRKTIAESLLLAQLEQLTGDAVMVSVTQLGPDRLSLRGLRISDALEIPLLDASYSPTGLLANRLDTIRVSGLRLRGVLDTSGVSFGALDLLADSPGGEEPTGAISLPASRLEIDDARIELATSEGPLVVSVDSSVSHKGPEQLEAKVELGVEHRLATSKTTLNAVGWGERWTGELSLDAALLGGFDPSIEMGRFTLSGRPTFAIEPEQLTIRADECVDLRIDRLAVVDGVRLTRPLALCARSESISIDRAGESIVDLVASIEPISLDFGGGLEVMGELPLVNIQGLRTNDGEISGSVTVERGHLEVPLTVGARGIHIEGSTSAESTGLAEARLRIEDLFDPQQPVRFSPLNLSANLRAKNDSIDAIEFDLEIADPERNVVVAFAGEHELERGVGRASVRLRPFSFCPGGVRLTDVLPVLPEVANQAAGSIEAKGTLAWDAEGTHGKIDVALRDVSATVEGIEVEHLYAAVTLLESGTPPGQLLSIGRIAFGLELTDGEILFQVLPDGQIAIESAVWGFAGGELSTAGQLDPHAAQQTLAFDVRGVDLAQLVELAALDGLSGTGTLEGRLPLERDGDRIDIRRAELHSGPEGGVIRYQPEPTAASLADADSQFGVLLEVLEDFHYTHLSLEIDGDAAGKVIVGIHLAGSNPGYQGGAAVNFNLSIDSHLSDLIAKENVAYQLPYLIEERFQAFSGGEMNLPPSPCVHPPESLDDGATQR